MAEYTVKVKTYEATDSRLGRHVRHDSRSLAYQVKAQDVFTLASVRHERYIPTLDQGHLGSCTGNAAIGVLGTGLFWATIEHRCPLSTTDAVKDENYAVSVYGGATDIDSYAGGYPPNDTGSDGLSVAKVLQGWGLISGYQHATSIEALLTALAKQPVIVGTEWRADMFDPDADGRIHITGAVQGGHEYVLDELDVENKRVWLHNSWGNGWGIEGRAYLTWDDMTALLAAQGDCTVFTPLNVPAPTPEPVPVADPKEQFIGEAQEWMSHRHRGINRTFEKELQTFIDWYA